MALKTKKKISDFLLWAIPLTIFISSLIIFITLSLVVISGYKEWESTYHSKYNQSNFVTNTDEKIKNSLESKITTYSKSTKDIDTISLTSQEFGYLFMSVLNEDLPSYISVERMMIIPNKGEWTIYANTKISGINFWLSLILNKDEGEGVDIYISDILLGNYSFSEYGIRKPINSVNKGIKESIFLLTQKDFSGRRILNIELDNNDIFIKGKK